MGKRGNAAFTEFEITRTKERDGTVYKVPALAAKTTNHAPDADVFGPRTMVKKFPVSARALETLLEAHIKLYVSITHSKGRVLSCFTVDMSAMTAPPFIFLLTSLTEFQGAISFERLLMPLNPVLGELLYGYQPASVAREGKTTLVGEHRNAVGHAVLTGSLPSGETEEYLITLPRLRIDGLWYGSPYIELAETSYVQSSTWWLSTIEYKGKGYFSGKSHTFKTPLTPPSHIHTSPHVIKGTGHAMSKELHGGATFHDVTSPKEEITVAPGEEQGEQEVVNEQRQRRRDESASGTTWELKHFKHTEHGPVYERLCKLFKTNPPAENGYVHLGNVPRSET
ncbi:hypothetical protein DFJ58DRAFT_845757 [Suillus subalutaceus]|uniref:uncharacterized protein n=1 Tax=Suillus subalutaceus TaxID=48586 RepID=UPI001B8870D5|nr:uncharacterized protein DFJ58DRAFT_845757 [Suillus subalutaceus]KAG1839337.1 hypothetical protein DFJ58DRAFT_845757 [Suillus subalutaceus]